MQHLNSDANHIFVEHLLEQVNAQEYRKFQAPIYAYIAKLNTNDGNWIDGKIYLYNAISTLEQVDNSNLLIDIIRRYQLDILYSRRLF